MTRVSTLRGGSDIAAACRDARAARVVLELSAETAIPMSAAVMIQRKSPGAGCQAAVRLGVAEALACMP